MANRTSKRHKPAKPLPPPSSTPPDPIDIIVANWAQLAGWPRDRTKTQLALIGHMSMKKNVAGIRELEKELQDAIDQIAARNAAAEAGG